ncbi:hypothetical protein [Liquorilactobacillus hordei]|uniref:hypothetical protein n=1 Tax=Liquorilactobacillus hordei TaxID=468911 RepID=UPI0039EA477C
MTEYKVGDKVVLQLPKIGCNALGKQVLMLDKNSFLGVPVSNDIVLGKLEDFQPKEEKIKFTPEMKEEFDGLKSRYADLYSAMDALMEKDDHNVLKKYLFLDSLPDNANQYQFSLAWGNPSRIEVIEPEKYEIKIGRQYLQLNKSNVFLLASDLGIVSLRTELTLDEVKEAEKQLGIQGLQAKWHEAAKEDQG